MNWEVKHGAKTGHTSIDKTIADVTRHPRAEDILGRLELEEVVEMQSNTDPQSTRQPHSSLRCKPVAMRPLNFLEAAGLVFLRPAIGQLRKGTRGEWPHGKPLDESVALALQTSLLWVLVRSHRLSG